MNFTEIAQARQSCRSYTDRPVEQEKLDAILASARLAPSACNSQPYRITVCRGEAARQAALACQELGMNKFATQAPVVLVLSEEEFSPVSTLGPGAAGMEFRGFDIGILTAFITAEAAAQGLGTCILGLLDAPRLKELCGFAGTARLAILLGYSNAPLRKKVRKDMADLVTYRE